MAILGGVPLSGFASPSSDLDAYPSHKARYGHGGHRSVPDLTERDLITTDRREEGMTVYVISESITYMLVGGITNADWIVDSSTRSAMGMSPIFNPYEFDTYDTQSVYDTTVKIDDKAVEVVYNGIVLPPSDYVIGVTDITVDGLINGGKLVVKVYESVSVANTYTQAEVQNYVDSIINNIQER